MNDLTREGIAIMMVSSEMEEVLGMADRIMVMHKGKIAGEMKRREATEEKIIALSTGK
jgi:ribose transport system ATP-binding protein